MATIDRFVQHLIKLGSLEKQIETIR